MVEVKVVNVLPDSTLFPNGCVAAVGNFDGVHLGHQEVFATAVARAGAFGLPAVLLTFASHPLTIVNPGAAPAPLMTVDDRLGIARQTGFEAAIVLDFDQELASMSPEEFAARMLVERIGIRELVAGKGWRFGRGRSGDMEWLSGFGQGAGLTVRGVGPVMIEGRPVSSTWVRESLARGDVGEVARLLGRPHFVRGTVIRGEGRGRDLGFPTVNLDCHGVLVPAHGVYAGGYRVGEASGPAALSVGPAPTFEGGHGIVGSGPRAALEGHLIGLDRDLYGQTLTIAFFRRLRDQRPFPDVDTLSRQIALDVEAARKECLAFEICTQNPKP
ncbi:MAG: riboflavin biosynthesis protein RibF [bacterium]|nr:riboflavin biosynthesis protein RibF [bacterium]